jgi:hypothetical protein
MIMTDKTISTREADLLRKRIAFVVRNGGYRVVCTDSESPDGILPRCTSPAHPEDDRERQWDVLDCCQTEDGYPLIETGHEHIAAVWVDSLYVIPALLDERDVLRARVAELEAARDDDLCVIAAFLLPNRRPIEHWLAILANHFGPRAQELTQDPERFAAARFRVDRVPAEVAQQQTGGED